MGASDARGLLPGAVEAAGGALVITEPELAFASEQLQDASDEVDAWVLHDRTRVMREEVEAHDATGKAAAAEGATLRAAAQGTEAVLLEAVRDVCGDDMEINCSTVPKKGVLVRKYTASAGPAASLDEAEKA